MAERYWLETLGCPKNQVDSDKLAGVMTADGLVPASSPAEADLVVVNTCAFIEAARQESVDTILALADQRRNGARLVVTGCMAERYGDELAASLPEVDLVAGFGVPVHRPAPRPAADSVGSVPVELSRRPNRDRGTREGAEGRPDRAPSLDLLELPRPPASAPWAYVKVAEGCDRACGFCAIPSFRGKQRSRTVKSILAEVEALDAQEIVLVAQDLASYGRDDGRPGALHDLVAQVARQTSRVRLLYLYPSELNDRLIDTICSTGVPYFDLSLQHVSRPLMRRMRRWGGEAVFMDRLSSIRAREPGAAFRSSFIVGYPGETEEDHDALLRFVEEAQLDWASFFAYSKEEGTYAAGLDRAVPDSLMRERMAELGEIQDRITGVRRAGLIGERVEVLVDSVGVGRSYREAPEIDGIIEVPRDATVGRLAEVEVVGAAGPDLSAAWPDPAVPALTLSTVSA